MTDARELYLKTYGIMNTLDKYISSASIGYTAMNYVKVMGLAVITCARSAHRGGGGLRSGVKS
jgi:hypothetical protein